MRLGRGKNPYVIQHKQAHIGKGASQIQALFYIAKFLIARMTKKNLLTVLGAKPFLMSQPLNAAVVEAT